MQTVRKDGRITCDCMWMTMEMPRNRNFRYWKPCKHIKQLNKILEEKMTEDEKEQEEQTEETSEEKEE